MEEPESFNIVYETPIYNGFNRSNIFIFYTTIKIQNRWIRIPLKIKKIFPNKSSLA